MDNKVRVCREFQEWFKAERKGLIITKDQEADPGLVEIPQIGLRQEIKMILDASLLWIFSPQGLSLLCFPIAVIAHDKLRFKLKKKTKQQKKDHQTKI